MPKKNAKRAGRKAVPANANKQYTKIRYEKILKEAESLFESLKDKEQEILRTEDALVETMRRFRDIFEQSPIGIAIYDTEGEILMINSSFLKVFGLDSFTKIKEQNLFDDMKLSPADGKELRGGKAVQHEIAYDFEKFDMPTSREGLASMLLTVSPLFRENNIIGYMAQVQDVTERRKIAESQRLAQLGRLLSDIAHEVNNPLMIISGRAELALMAEVKDPELKRALELILDQCFTAKDIIQRLLKYARLGKIKKNPVDVAKTVELVGDILEHQFRMAEIVLEKHIEPGLPMIMGNEKQLQEVFMNILHNAVDAMPDGGHLSVKVARNKGFLKLEFRDNGVGMPAKVLSRICEPFFTTKEKGTGLGMAISHTIIQEHGGDIRYSSKIGKGTTVIISLPVGK